MKLLNNIFPFKLYLTVFQLEEYKPFRFLKWLSKNFLRRSLPKKKGLVFTTKIKLILIISAVWFLVFLKLSLILAFALLLQPYILFFLAILTLKPYEIWNKKRIIRKTRAKIKLHKNLKVIGITGSYAKTSVKEILYQLLKKEYKTLRTPESYNTVFGIAKVVDLELDNSYKFFVCELGAYHPGEIKELCTMVNPNFGIITGITQQHLERFKSLENIKKTKFELFDYIQDTNKMVFNIKDPNVTQEMKDRDIQIEKILKTHNIKFTPEGSLFTLEIKGKQYKIKTKLFGFAQVQNIALAASFALKLGLSPQKIIQRVEELKPFTNRFILRKNQKTTLVDNTYNSNVAGFSEMLTTARTVSGKKALVTPGIVELGKEEAQIHNELGVKARGIFDQIILVGRNQKTKNLEEGLGKDEKVEYINDNREEYNRAIESLILKKIDWVFLENDVTENY
jgi:UDP-N-acetylmuramoyl-tripeptide--D-alanyl-D-alanine ligase